MSRFMAAHGYKYRYGNSPAPGKGILVKRARLFYICLQGVSPQMVLRVMQTSGAVNCSRAIAEWHQDIYYINSLDTFSTGLTRLRLMRRYYRTFLTNTVTLTLPFF